LQYPINELSDEEWKYIELTPTIPKVARMLFNNIISARNSKNLSPEERVKSWCHDGNWCVVVDSNRNHPLSAYNIPSKVVDVYKNYVISEISKE